MISLARRRFLPILALLSLPLVARALPPQRDGVPARHYILESDAPLDALASAELATRGIEVQQSLANHRYLVRMRDDVEVPHDARIRSIRIYDAAEKIARDAYAEAAKGQSYSRLRVLFQKDVTPDDAQRAVEAVGGTLDNPFVIPVIQPTRLTVRIPTASIPQLAGDERVFGVYGPPLHPRSLNAVAALVSKVTPLFSSPYNLSGDGVVLSLFEPDGYPDPSHQEFGGRVINHFASDRPVNDHATHVAGTIVASGVNPAAKGMSPKATLQAFDANTDFNVLLVAKAALSGVGSVADNNSWDYGISWQGSVWYGAGEYLAGYSALESAPYDAVNRRAGAPLVLHAAGNDALEGSPVLSQPWSPHKHFNYDTNQVDTHTFCYSQSGAGNDCTTAPPFNCSTGQTSAGETYCEKDKHPTHTAPMSVGLLGSMKNIVTVGAVQSDGQLIAPFSSQGPAQDGRIKPELVAKGYRQFSTMPNNQYSDGTNCACPGFGTSMATPVVTGIAGLLTEQYRKTFNATPSAPLLKTLLIAGADDLGNPGPDYVYGFGLADAKASVDLIRADGGTGSQIRSGTVANGQDVDIPITVSTAQKVRVVLGWFDPEVLLVPDPTIKDDDPLAGKTLVNDLDLRIVDPSGNAVLPYVLSPSTPSAFATRGVNHIDTTEEAEIAAAAPGTYHVIVHGAIGDTRSTTQDYIVVVSGASIAPPCTDNYEPNDTQAAAFGNVPSGQTITPKICSASDTDYFTFTTNSLSSFSVSVTASDTPLKVTLSSVFSATVTQVIPAGTSATVTSNLTLLTLPTPNVPVFVRVEANGTVGASGSYSLRPVYTFNSTPRKRSAKH